MNNEEQMNIKCYAKYLSKHANKSKRILGEQSSPTMAAIGRKIYLYRDSCLYLDKMQCLQNSSLAQQKLDTNKEGRLNPRLCDNKTIFCTLVPNGAEKKLRDFQLQRGELKGDSNPDLRDSKGHLVCIDWLRSFLKVLFFI